MTIVCKICGKPLPPGRHAYCSDACAHIGRRSSQRDWQRAYYLRHINATPDESDAFRQKLRDRASAYYARKKQSCSDTPDADVSKAEPK